MLWHPYDYIDLYCGYLGPIDGLCSVDVVCGDWSVPDFIFKRILLVSMLMAILQVLKDSSFVRYFDFLSVEVLLVCLYCD